jgi:hypothetical protein
MKTKSVIMLAILIVLVLIMAIGLRGSTLRFQKLIPNLNGIQTAAVSTFVSNLTQTAVVRPTFTFAPSLIPTATPTAININIIEASATPTSSCYRLRFIKDVTIPDFSIMKPGETFTKTWRVLNNGTCAWQPGFRFAFYGGDPMGGSNYILTQTLAPGKQMDLSLSMITPNGVGIVISTWRMSDPTGWFFGDALTVKIDLGGETPTS